MFYRRKSEDGPDGLSALVPQLKSGVCGRKFSITRPAHITADQVAADDLALDLWVAPDGECRVLDEDEFAALPLTPAEREAAQRALAELQTMVAQRTPPFDWTGDDG